jgi:hypothetical protein
MNILLPLMTQWSPSRTARVRMPATSEPASGSVTATAHTFSPRINGGRYRSSCCGVPKLARCGEAMSVCTVTVTAKPP